MRKYKKPSFKSFKDISDKLGGNISAIAKYFKVSRNAIYDWARDDENFKNIIDDHRGKVLDECFVTSRILARGIPKQDEEGKIIGWEERPDSSMVRYLMSTLGRNEGFGEKLDVTTNGKDLQTGIQVEIIDKREQVISEDTDN